ncbi:MAG TPA: exodeoxyribonuclease VII large subunit [Solirubrobacteraceae bacterium]|jgi:exodeoxyribonuclease VII large subunit
MSSVEQQVEVAAVGEYAARIERALRKVGGGIVEGEVQRPKRVGGGRMLVFDLTDGDAVLSCKVFARDLGRLQHVPAHGDLVQVRIERPDFYAATGRVSVIVTGVRLAGEGELLRRRSDLLERLAAEGLTDASRRKPLPAFPRAVGVIAGRSSDGMSDVVRALRDRFPPVHVVTCAALVQGAAAPRDLIDALARLQEHPLVDVIVVARGGGSVQDLVAFDDERLCRALFACDTPVITAIGHTDNVPVCNHVAWAAYTPSRSAEMAVPAVAELRQGLALAGRRVDDVPVRIARGRERIEARAGRLRAGARLDGLLEDVRRGDLAAALRARLSERGHGVAEARAALAAAARRVPGVEELRVLGVRLDARADRFFAARAALVEEAGRGLGAVARDLADREAAVAEQARLVAMGTHRQLADHDRDYGRALARLGREAAAGATRRLREAARGATDLAALVAAHDPRPRGWLLAARGDGTPVRRAADVARGAALRLDFADGRVEARAESITDDTQEAA